MTNFVYGFKNWQDIYRQSSSEEKNRIWIYVKFSNGQDIYLKNYEDWLNLKEFVGKNNLSIDTIGLRYRSHEVTVDTSGSDATYMVRSVKGEFGGSTKNCYTTGYLKNNVVHKTMWITPELVEESSYVDDLDNCFEEAIIYHGTGIKKTVAV
jgi:hypothetical protein